jgi:hypothetical protein
MTNKQSKNTLPPTTGNDPIPKLDMENKEKGIETMYLKDDQKQTRFFEENE